MDEQFVNLGSVVGKDLLNLDDGSFLGRVQGITVDTTNRCIVGVVFKQKGLLGSKNTVPFANIKYFGSHTVTVVGLPGASVLEGRDILGMSVVTVDGTALGSVMDFAFKPVTGEIMEYMLKGGVSKNETDDRGLIAAEKIVAIGKDAIIALAHTSQEDLKKPEADVYGDWKEVDEIIEGLNEEHLWSEDDDDDNDDGNGADTTETYEAHFDEVTDMINKTFEDMTNKIKDINTDELTDKIKDQADKFSEEAMNFLGTMKEKLQQNKFSNLDAETLKQDFKNKMNARSKKEDNAETLANQMVEQLKGASVVKPLLDAEGNVIVWPGQVIGNEEVKMAIKAGKLQELINLTTEGSEADASKKVDTPESKTPESKTPESKTPESKTPESKTPESKTPESKTPESKTPESKTPESKTPESKTPESKTPESKTPESKTPESKTPESKTPKSKMPESKISKSKTPKSKTPKSKADEKDVLAEEKSDLSSAKNPENKSIKKDITAGIVEEQVETKSQAEEQAVSGSNQEAK